MLKVKMLLMLGGFAASVTVTAAGDAIGHARLHPIGQSGIQAQIFFVDDGSTRWVLGVAQGLDPVGRGSHAKREEIFHFGSLGGGSGDWSGLGPYCAVYAQCPSTFRPTRSEVVPRLRAPIV